MRKEPIIKAMEQLHNSFLKIAPIERKTFLPTENVTYNEIGIVLDVDPEIKNIPIGSKVKFDKFLAYKFPVEGKDGEYEWYVKTTEVISHELT